MTRGGQQYDADVFSLLKSKKKKKTKAHAGASALTCAEVSAPTVGHQCVDEYKWFG